MIHVVTSDYDTYMKRPKYEIMCEWFEACIAYRNFVAYRSGFHCKNMTDFPRCLAELIGQ